MFNTIKVFIAYSWDNEAHQQWVLNLANNLVNNGIDVLLDQYDLKFGKNLTHFMERSVAEADKVLLIFTENYKQKAEKRQGGVGYEYSMINAEWYENQTGNTKFIPILRQGSKKTAIPVFASAYIYLDMTKDANYATQLEELLRYIYDAPKVVKPKLGKRPNFANPTMTIPPTNTPKETIQQKMEAQEAAAQKVKTTQTKAYIRDLIGRAKLEQALLAFDQLATELNNEALQDRLLYQKAKYKKAKDDNLIGIIAPNDYRRERAIVTKNLLDLLKTT